MRHSIWLLIFALAATPAALVNAGEQPAAGERATDATPPAPDRPEQPAPEPAPPAPVAKKAWDNPDFTQPDIKDLPKDDAEARAALKTAYESVYSAQRLGLKKFASDASITVELTNPGAGNVKTPIRVDLKLAWLGGAVANVKALAEKAGASNPITQQIRPMILAQLPNFGEKLPWILGNPPFDEKFDGRVFVRETCEQEGLTIIRSWWTSDDDGLTSEVMHIREGCVEKVLLPGVTVTFGYEKKGRDLFVSSVSNLYHARDAAGAHKTYEAKYVIAERSVAGDYTVATKITTSGKYGMMPFTVALEFTNITINDKVTDDMVKSATEDDTPAPVAPDKPSGG